MISSRTKPLPILLLFIGIAAFYISLTALVSIAHADAGSDAPAVEHVLVQTPALQVEAPTSPLAIVGVILGGLALLLTGIERILAAVAPRTKTTIDDTVLAEVREVLAFIRGLPIPIPALAAASAPSTTTVNVTTSEPADAAKLAASRSADGKSGPGTTLIALFLLGLVVTQPACSGTTGQRAGAGVTAVLDCESANLKAAALSAGNLAQAAIISTISGSGHVDYASLKAALTGIKDAGLQCAIAGAVAVLAQPAKPSAVMAAGLEVQGDELRAAFARARVELEWPAIGTVQ